MQRLVKSFPAEDDAGHHYTVEVYQDYATGSGQRAGAQSFETSYGTRVNRVKRGEYQLKNSGKLLHSNHPDAE